MCHGGYLWLVAQAAVARGKTLYTWDPSSFRIIELATQTWHTGTAGQGHWDAVEKGDIWCTNNFLGLCTDLHLFLFGQGWRSNQRTVGIFAI